MGLGTRIITGIAGTGLAAGVAYGLGGFDDTTRDEAGNIVESGGISVFNVQVGDCLLDIPGGEMVADSVGVPCSEPHLFEVYYEELITGLDSFDQQAIGERADAVCFEQYEQYVGTPYESSTLDFSSLVPTSESWAQGDNEITCLIASTDGSELTGSARSSGL